MFCLAELLLFSTLRNWDTTDVGYPYLDTIANIAIGFACFYFLRK